MELWDMMLFGAALKLFSFKAGVVEVKIYVIFELLKLSDRGLHLKQFDFLVSRGGKPEVRRDKNIKLAAWFSFSQTRTIYYSLGCMNDASKP